MAPTKEEKNLFKLNVTKFDFEEMMGISVTDMSSYTESKRNKCIRSFNEKCKTDKQTESMSWIDGSEDELPGPSIKRKRAPKPEEKDKDLLMNHGENYFVNKKNGQTNAHLLQVDNIPEYTVISIDQAKYVHVDNKFGSKKGKIGTFIIECSVIGQILPANESTDVSDLSQSTIVKEKHRISNPDWVEQSNGIKSFKLNAKSDVAYFKTMFDGENNCELLNFGAEKIGPNETKSTTQGRHQRSLLPSRFSVFSNASLQKMILSLDPELEEPVLMYRQCKTDPLHRHNLGFNQKPYVTFSCVSSSKLLELGIYHKDIENNTVVDVDLDQVSNINSSGDIESINKVTNLLIHVLKISESDLRENTNIAISMNVNGSDFKMSIPSFINIKQGQKMRKGRSKKKSEKTSAEETPRSRSPIKDISDEDDDESDNLGI